MKSLFLIVLLSLSFDICSAQSVVTYPSPAVGFAKVSDRYVVSVTQGGVTQQSFVYKSTSGIAPSSQWGTQINKRFHFTTFSFSGSVTIRVTKLSSTATSAVVRPTRLGIGTLTTTNVLTNKTVSFIMSKPGKVSVEFNDDPTHADAMMIFADTLETNIPSKTASNVLLVPSTATAASLASIPSTTTIVYFQPGVYSLGNRWTIPNTVKQVYIAGGAYVKGYLYRNNVLSNALTNTITINGRGIISNEGFPFHYPSTPADGNANNWYYPICLRGGLNHLVEGITLIEASGFNILINATNSTVQNVNINGFMFNNDAITIQGTGHKIDNCFIRDNDDAIVPYATNLSITNCVVWQLHGTFIQLGWSPHSMGNFYISNCDVIHDENTNPNGNTGFINAMLYSPVSPAIAADVNNITVKNIYFDTPVLRFLDIRNDRTQIMSTPPVTYAFPWVYRNFNISNIYFSQTVTSPLFYLHGYDDNHPIVNVTFQNIYLNNVNVTATKMTDSTFFSQHRVSRVILK